MAEVIKQEIETEEAIEEILAGDYLDHEGITVTANWLTGEDDMDAEYVPDRISQLNFD